MPDIRRRILAFSDIRSWSGSGKQAAGYPAGYPDPADHRISGIRQTDCRISGSSKDGKVVLLGLQPRRGKFKIKILDYSSKLPISGRISGLRQTGCRISGWISGSGRPPDIRNPVERPNPDPVLIRRPNFRSGTTLNSFWIIIRTLIDFHRWRIFD